MWHVPQAFSWGWCRPEEVGKNPDLRMPSRAELANMTWQGIAGGANGVCYYRQFSFDFLKKGAERSRIWADICSVAREIKAQEAVLLSDPASLPLAGLPKSLVARAYVREDGFWLLIVNRTDKAVRAKIGLPQAIASAQVVCGDGVRLEGSSLEIGFQGLGYALVSLGR